VRTHSFTFHLPFADLRREVESLLSFHESADSFLEKSLSGGVDDLTETAQLPTLIGANFVH
jgi:hypothetical protein